MDAQALAVPMPTPARQRDRLAPGRSLLAAGDDVPEPGFEGVVDRFMIDGADTEGRFALVLHLFAPKALAAPGGRFSAHGTPSGQFAEIDPAEADRLGVTVGGIQDVQLTDVEIQRVTREALAEAAAGRLTPVIGQTFPLSRAADAHAAIEARTVFGKTLLLP